MVRPDAVTGFVRLGARMTSLREANQHDEYEIANLLRTHEMRSEGVLHACTRYWVAEDAGRIVGAVGIELGRTAVLRRSAIVEPQSRGKGIGQALARVALDCARASGARLAYCFSTDAGSYWVARGFELCSVDEVVSALPTAPQ